MLNEIEYTNIYNDNVCNGIDIINDVQTRILFSAFAPQQTNSKFQNRNRQMRITRTCAMRYVLRHSMAPPSAEQMIHGGRQMHYGIGGCTRQTNDP